MVKIKMFEELLVVMSVLNDLDMLRDGEYDFIMLQLILFYLIVLVIGDLQFKVMGERIGVYVELVLLDVVVEEFEDIESMFEVMEQIYGVYSWDCYDLLILLLLFLFGGMENFCLFFIMFIVIVGDKSLVLFIVYELVYSWLGNMVINVIWCDLWLNEGFIMYFIYCIMEMVYGYDCYCKEVVLGYQDLIDDVVVLLENDEILVIDLCGCNLDDVFLNIFYEKGVLFLRELEQKVGRLEFDKFLVNYFQYFVFKSIIIDEFVVYFDKILLVDYVDKFDKVCIQEWIFILGIFVGVLVFILDVFEFIDQVRSNFLVGEVLVSSINM